MSEPTNERLTELLAVSGAAFDQIAKPASTAYTTNPAEPVISRSGLAIILGILRAHGVTADVLLGDLDNWKPTGFLGGMEHGR